jgi:catechol 2,3-dioxygenase-like lactoylglutathione lyase family enzyme
VILGIHHTALSTRGLARLVAFYRDLEKEVERLAGAGMRFLSGPVEQTPEVSNCYGRDPDGNLIELIEFR